MNGSAPERLRGPRCYELGDGQLAALTRLFYGGRAAPTFERAASQQVRAALDAVGLTGDFWRLPGPGDGGS